MVTASQSLGGSLTHTWQTQGAGSCCLWPLPTQGIRPTGRVPRAFSQTLQLPPSGCPMSAKGAWDFFFSCAHRGFSQLCCAQKVGRKQLILTIAPCRIMRSDCGVQGGKRFTRRVSPLLCRGPSPPAFSVTDCGELGRKRLLVFRSYVLTKPSL